MVKELLQYNEIVKIVASNPVDKGAQCRKLTLRPIELRGEEFFQAEMRIGTQSFHQNIPSSQLSDWFGSNVDGKFRQVLFAMRGRDVTYLLSAKGKLSRVEKLSERAEGAHTNNRAKQYILNEGDDIPAMVDLGIFTKERKVVAGMYGKFKQINRFVEVLDDVFKAHTGSLTLLDFGCGKSYLTFIVYHYLTKVRNLDAKIIGYDLKADVVAHCNEIAAKYGYGNLHFVVADVARDELYAEQIDAVISLHACDTATDHALNFAVTHNVPYIFSVPCCQHEVNNSISAGGGDLDALLRYGIVKERVSALLTDTVRAMLLEDAGYRVDVMEFVDLAHSPKNIMLRCVKTGKPCNRNKAQIEQLMQRYGFEQTLYRLMCGR